MPTTKTTQTWSLASVALHDAYTDFILSRQAMNCTPVTMSFYRFTAGKFLEWIEQQGLTNPEQIAARHVRQFLAELTNRGLQDTTKHDYARAIRTLLRFWHIENYLPAPVRFEMPRLEKKRLPVLTAEQLKQIVNACNVRDKAIVLFLVDSGLRRAEVVSLSWADVDMTSGLVRVKRGKGKKDRSAVIGATTRRALLAYRRTLADREGYCCKPTKARALPLAALFVSSSAYPSGLGYTSQLTPYAGLLLFCHFAMG
jgi:site-specific recombinase XerD